MKRRYIIIGATAILVFMLAMIFVLARKSSRLQEELLEERSMNQVALSKLESMRKLGRIDSLVIKGRLSEALNAYEAELKAADSELTDQIELRIKWTERLLGLNQPAIEADSSLINDMADSLSAIQSEAVQDTRQYDSLRFALEKMQVQMEQLRQQLRVRSSGTYLTFPSIKGTTMHYVGEVRNGKANGDGIALLATGSRYVGEWKDNQRHGKGTFYWPDGEYYQGEYRNDTRTGQGTYYWPSGEKFIGEWENDERNGEGKFYNAEGEVIAKGIWKDDELVEVEKD